MIKVIGDILSNHIFQFLLRGDLLKRLIYATTYWIYYLYGRSPLERRSCAGAHWSARRLMAIRGLTQQRVKVNGPPRQRLPIRSAAQAAK